MAREQSPARGDMYFSQLVDRRTFLGTGLRRTAVTVAPFSWPSIPTIGETEIFFAIDTMKYTRDRTEDPEALKTVDIVAERVAEAEATHIGIGTPYDPEGMPMMRASVRAARDHGLKVFFRGNAAGAEGWFNAPVFTDSSQHDVLIWNFITQNPDLFEADDRFSESPEPENTFIGDPRNLKEGDPDRFLSFVVSSYRNASAAFQTAGLKEIEHGYFSTNGDVARDIFTKDVVAELGKITVDHYVEDPKQFGSDIDHLHELFNAKVVIGEWGGPIPNIHGQLSEVEQARLVDEFLREIADRTGILRGMNYWTLIYGSTALLNDDFSKREAFYVLSEGYKAMREQLAKQSSAQ